MRWIVNLHKFSDGVREKNNGSFSPRDQSGLHFLLLILVTRTLKGEGIAEMRLKVGKGRLVSYTSAEVARSLGRGEFLSDSPGL